MSFERETKETLWLDGLGWLKSRPAQLGTVRFACLATSFFTDSLASAATRVIGAWLHSTRYPGWGVCTVVARVRWVTGNKILRILKGKGLAPDLPEDLYSLIKKAVAIRKHLERNRKDRDSKFRLILVESRIHRLVRYYKAKRILAPTWRYESSTASALVA
ncbi:hypothetical protein V5799_026838 [Amblyomma americanum]|uniref:40S ribosomal protein S13 n=1 Tax=Amblyomma americanum TaxID=6943 RepID=A0AAQ4DHF5_AMBAM